MELCGQRPFSLPVLFILIVALIWIPKGSDQLTSDPLVLPVTSEIVPTTPIALAAQPRERVCSLGFQLGGNGQCLDVDECKIHPYICSHRTLQQCFNTVGSYRCVDRICPSGYIPDPNSRNNCIDVDECADNTYKCDTGLICRNRIGNYTCECPAGHALNPDNQCIDIDECSINAELNFGSVCGSTARYENTVGSYRCICNAGFVNVAIGHVPGVCDDVDECRTTPGLCTHDCINTWGSYICSCEPGYRYNSDNRSCEDIDECEEFKKNNLCSDICVNTPGSNTCSCPAGYKVGPDGRTCKDINECALGQACQDPSEACLNTRGSFRCIKYDCPDGYVINHERKNQCTLARRDCSEIDLACFHKPKFFDYNYITVSSILLTPTIRHLELFTVTSGIFNGLMVRFSMALVNVRAPPNVVPATENYFALIRPEPSKGVIRLIRHIAGPQEIELEVLTEAYLNSTFYSTEVFKFGIFVD